MHTKRMSWRRRRAVPVVAAVAAMLSACSGSADSAAEPTTIATSPPPVSEPRPTASAPPVVATTPAGMRRVDGTGFTLALPVSWSAYQLAADGTVVPLDGAGPLATGLDGLATAAALQGASVFGVAPPNAAGRSTTVLVTPVGPDDQPASADVSDVLRERLAAEGISDVRTDIIDIDGGRGARATFHQIDQSGLEQEATTVYVPRDQHSFILSSSQPMPTDSPSMIDAIVATFRTP